MENLPDSPFVIFDGVCNFCNASVNFILKYDKKGVFKFAANQSEFAQQFLTENEKDPEDVDAIYVYDKGKLLSHSSAVLTICKYLPFPWRLLSVFFIVPKFIRDAGYNLIARNRYKLMGKKDACRIPTPEERERFIMG